MTLEMIDKLYLQLAPDDEDVRKLVLLQGRLRTAMVRGQFVDPSRLHVTLLHIGELQRAYDEMNLWSPGIKPDIFIDHAQLLVRSLQTLVPIDTTIDLVELVRYGAAGNTLAVRVEVEPRIIEIHSTAVGMLRRFFVDSGLSYPDAFMQGSMNFRYALTLSPHVTLVKSATATDVVLLEKDLHRVRTHTTPIVTRRL